jgi:hypothetical protein
MPGGFRPPLFLFTALLWLLSSIVLGFTVWIASRLGAALPPQLRVMHAHMALVGGVAQMIFGALLAFIPPLLLMSAKQTKNRPFQYLLLNGGTLGMVIGFGIGDLATVGFSGAAVGTAFLILFSETLGMVRQSVQRTGLNLWFYGIALLSLLAGIGLGETIAFGGISSETIGLARLSHLHLNLIGFVTLTIIGTMQTMFPTVADTKLYSARLAMLTFVTMPPAILGLIGGFLLAQPGIQIAAGCVLLIGAGAYGWNMLQTWRNAGMRPSSPVLHLLSGTGWLILTIAVGIFLAWNNRTEPPSYPLGTAHLMAYSHMALIGFILQTILGALSHLLPIIVSLTRVKSHKKRRSYLETLNGVMDRGKWLQLVALNLGTAMIPAWAISAGVFGLHATQTAVMFWSAVSLLMISFFLFGGKLVLLAGRPEE